MHYRLEKVTPIFKMASYNWPKVRVKDFDVLI